MDLEEALNCLEYKGRKKGYALEVVIEAYYKQHFSHVFLTEKFDKGVDLILFDDSNRTRRIGVQIKNISRYIDRDDIYKMVQYSKDYYGLTELWLISKTDVKYSAQATLNKYNIKQIPVIEVERMIQFVENEYEFDTRDFRELFFDTVNDIGYWKFKRQTIIEIMETKPRTIAQLKSIYGIGDFIAGIYGEAIIDLVEYFIFSKSWP